MPGLHSLCPAMARPDMQLTHVAHWAGEECARRRCRRTCVSFCRVFPDAATLLTVWLMRHGCTRGHSPRWGHVCNEAGAGACDGHTTWVTPVRTITLGVCLNAGVCVGVSGWRRHILTRAAACKGGMVSTAVQLAARIRHEPACAHRTCGAAFLQRPAHTQQLWAGSPHHITCLHVYSLSAWYCGVSGCRECAWSVILGGRLRTALLVQSSSHHRAAL